MESNIFETLQFIQNERFAQGNAVFNDSITVISNSEGASKIIERELAGKRKEWQYYSTELKGTVRRIKELEAKRNLTPDERKQLEFQKQRNNAFMKEMRQIEQDANTLKAMSDKEKTVWALQKRIKETIKRYQSAVRDVSRGRRLGRTPGQGNTSFIPEKELKQMPRADIEWLITEGEEAKKLRVEAEKRVNTESNRAQREIDAVWKQISDLRTRQRGLVAGGDFSSELERTLQSNDSELGRLRVMVDHMIQDRDAINAEIRAYNHIVEQGNRARRALNSMPRETATRNIASVQNNSPALTSAMAAFQ